MASILDRYGIKEVADVTFYHINELGQPDYPVLYLDTLKVSTIEQTAEQVDARGGKGNPKLITWDYGKEISVTIEDALFSPKSMALTWAGANSTVNTVATEKIKKSLNYLLTTAGALPEKVYKQADGSYAVSQDGTDSTGIDVTWYDVSGAEATEGTTGDRFIGSFEVTASARKQITVDAANFPGTYYITGDTYARNDANGEDEFFQFIIYKAKVSAENSITLEAEGDSSTFNMNLTVLRNQEGKMMELIQYKV